MKLFASSLRTLRGLALALVAYAWLAAIPALGRPMPFLPDVDVGSATTPEAVVAGDIDGDGDLDLAATARAADEVVWFEDTGSGFTRRVVTATLDEPVGLALGDVDCDGDLDLVIAASGSDTVVWYRNRGRTNAWTLGATLSTTASDVSSLAVGDLNGDGDLDVVGALPGSNEIVRWRNQGCPGTSWSSATVASLSTAPVDVALGDVDRDGRPDVVAALPDADTVAWYRNSGAGAWPQTTIRDSVEGVTDVAVGDVDRDGWLDVASAASVDTELAWWKNPGAGTTWGKVRITGDLTPVDVQLADIDGDGDLDLLSASGSGNEALLWWENTRADGSRWTEHTIDGAPGTPRAIVAFDRGPDGDVDIASASFLLGGVRLYENASTHRSGLLSDGGSALHLDSLGEVADWEVGDLDGDGRPDLVVTGRDVATSDAVVSWMRNLGPNDDGAMELATSQQISIETVYGYEDLAVGDLDGDGDLDVLIGGAGESFGGTLCLNDGGASSWSCGSPITGYDSLRGVELGDIDGDGDLDAAAAAVLTAGSGRSVVWWQAGGSGSWPANVVEPVLGGLDRVLPRDVDGDGDLDLLTNTESWWRHDGASPPGWVEEAIPVPPLTQIFGTEPGDVDGDGDLDVVAEVGTPDGHALFWFENDLDGPASSWIEHTVRDPEPNVNYEDLAVVDLDVDGDLDVVAGRSMVSLGTSVVWYRNHVEQPTAPWHELGAPAPLGAEVSGFRVLTADFDGDGDPDVVGGRDEIDCASWLNGGGQFALPTAAVAPAGVGEAAETAVLRIDAVHLGRGGEAAMELTALALSFESPLDTPLTLGEVHSLVDEVRLYRDDGSGTFDPALDSRVLAGQVTRGPNELILRPEDGDPLAQHAPEQTPATYFVTVELEPAASLAAISPLTIRHAPAVGSGAENADFDVPLLGEAYYDVWATFDVLDTVSNDLIFADGFETGDLSEWSGSAPP
jgi:hypothetical protein